MHELWVLLGLDAKSRWITDGMKLRLNQKKVRIWEFWDLSNQIDEKSAKKEDDRT